MCVPPQSGDCSSLLASPWVIGSGSVTVIPDLSLEACSFSLPTPQIWGSLSVEVPGILHPCVSGFEIYSSTHLILQCSSRKRKKTLRCYLFCIKKAKEKGQHRGIHATLSMSPEVSISMVKPCFPSRSSPLCGGNIFIFSSQMTLHVLKVSATNTTPVQFFPLCIGVGRL